MVFLESGLGQGQLGRYTIPNGKTGYLTRVQTIASRNKGATITAYQYLNADDTSQSFSGAARLLLQLDSIEGSSELDLGGSIVLPAKTDFWFEVTDVATNNTAVQVNFGILLVDD